MTSMYKPSLENLTLGTLGTTCLMPMELCSLVIRATKEI